MIEGGCLCGAVRLTIDGEPLLSRQCWCRTCQRVGAGNAPINLFYPTSAVTISGPIAWFERVAASGNAIEHGFCPHCGTQLIARSPDRPRAMVVRSGALDDLADVTPPTMAIWTSAAPAWAAIDPSLDCHEGPAPHG